MGKSIGKLLSPVLSIFGGDDDDSAQREAAAAQERARASAEAAAQSQRNMQSNFAADLKTENLGKVVAGGSADSVAIEPGLKKKKSSTAGLASTLGINV